MISAIRRFLNELSGGPEPQQRDDGGCQLAAAALLYHVTAIDGSIAEAERIRLSDLVASRFGLDSGETRKLLAAAEDADKEAVDLYGFTSVLKRHLDEAERERVVGMMWELVYADGQVHEFEDNLIWRVAELLGVSSQARIRLKQAARSDAGE